MCNKLLLSVVKREGNFFSRFWGTRCQELELFLCVCRIEANANLLGNESSISQHEHYVQMMILSGERERLGHLQRKKKSGNNSSVKDCILWPQALSSPL
jgi:hypothetical protein